jgi:hypothetical protein
MDYDNEMERREKLARADEDNYTTCKVCDNEFFNGDEEEIEHTHICEACKEKMLKPEIAKQVGKTLRILVELNGYTAKRYTVEQIEKAVNIVFGTDINTWDMKKSQSATTDLYDDDEDKYIEAFKELEVE